MKYMLLIYLDERQWDTLSEAERQEIYAEYRKFSEEIQASGNYMTGSELHPTSAATSVRRLQPHWSLHFNLTRSGSKLLGQN